MSPSAPSRELMTAAPQTQPAPRNAWGPAHYLALLAIPLLAVEVWTVGAWLADGPSPITEFRSDHDTGWWMARLIEFVMTATVLVYIRKIVRDSRRDGRLSFDAHLGLAALSCCYIDLAVYNWFTPAWLYSSNLVNLNDPGANLPLMPNAASGEMVWPVFIELFGYPFGFIIAAVAANHVMRRAQDRNPRIGPGRLAAIAFLVGGTFGAAAYEITFQLNVWAGPGYRLEALGDHSEVIVFFFSTALVFGPIACLRYFKDDQGRTLTERGLDRLSPRRRAGVSLLATLTVTQVVVVLGWGFATAPFSLFSEAYDSYPRHIISGVCDAPGWSGTDYGPCPGSDGFRMPLRSGR